MKFIKKNENEHIISKNKSMFGRKYLTEFVLPLLLYFHECFPHFTETSNKG